MLPTDSRSPGGARGHLFTARLQLYALRMAREQPRALALLLLMIVMMIVLLLSRQPVCEVCRCAPAADAPLVPSFIPDAQRSTAMRITSPHDATAVGSATTMAHVVVGVMTANRFHRTRCAAQSATWLRRARRVVFFSDTADELASTELQAPLVAHSFEPSPTERIFAGGNWRAVPILRALAEGFFSAHAQAAIRAREEPLPRWTFMVDDDAFVFVPQMLAKIAALDADQPHYLGYAFIAAPHLEGIIPGKRQPLFANGGAGIAVSRGALAAALPIFAKCEETYKWNWPGDVRVAQCLLDAGVSLTWVHSFHAEAPGVIIHKQRPPPGSVPVGLHLPPISFHHVDPDTLHALERMQTVGLSVAALPHEVDFSPHAFQPLSATHPTSGVQLQMHYGFEVLLCPSTGCAAPSVTGRASAASALDAAATGLRATLQPGKFLAVFEAVLGEGGDGAVHAYRHTFTGGECWQGGGLMGGLSALVTTRCGECDPGESSWQASRSPSGLTVCSFALDQCTLHVSVSLPRCPRPAPVRRIGLDAGTAPGLANVVQDGVATHRWAGPCSEDAASSSCSTVQAPGNVTLWFRVLSGSAALRIRTVTPPGLHVVASDTMLLLSGGVKRTDQGMGTPQLEPPATSLAMHHTCHSAGTFTTTVTVEIIGAVPLIIGWRVVCT